MAVRVSLQQAPPNANAMQGTCVVSGHSRLVMVAPAPLACWHACGGCRWHVRVRLPRRRPPPPPPPPPCSRHLQFHLPAARPSVQDVRVAVKEVEYKWHKNRSQRVEELELLLGAYEQTQRELEQELITATAQVGVGPVGTLAAHATVGTHAAHATVGPAMLRTPLWGQPCCARRCGASHAAHAAVGPAMLRTPLWGQPCCARRCGASHAAHAAVGPAMLRTPGSVVPCLDPVCPAPARPPSTPPPPPVPLRPAVRLGPAAPCAHLGMHCPAGGRPPDGRPRARLPV